MYDTYPADRHGVILPLKICVGITSSLSIIGGFLVVLTFCIRLCQFRATHRTDGAQVPLTDSMRLKHEMMSPGRLIVVNLSIANILLAVSHLWGVAGEYQTFFDKNDNVNNSDPNGSTNAMCNVQGALAVYGTISSFLWTIILSFFVVGTLVLPHPKRYGSPLTLLAYLIVCWGIPLVIVIVIAVKREFGLEDEMTIANSLSGFELNPEEINIHPTLLCHKRSSGSAWCYILPKSKEQDLFINLFAYNVWSYLSMMLLVIFFIVTTCYTCRVSSPARDRVTENTPLVNQPINKEQEAKSDYFKLIFAALILVILRLWDAIYVSLGYLPHYDTHIRSSTWIVVLVFLAGIGNSAQGAANAVLFLLCTKTYRRWMIQSFTRCCRPSGGTELSTNTN